MFEVKNKDTRTTFNSTINLINRNNEKKKNKRRVVSSNEKNKNKRRVVSSSQYYVHDYIYIYKFLM